MHLKTLEVQGGGGEVGEWDLWKEIIRSKTGSLPGVVLKSKMRWWDCSRSGLLDDRVPLTGKAGGMCFDCLSPTMLSSWDWPMPMSLHPERNKVRTNETDIQSLGYTRGMHGHLYHYIFTLSVISTVKVLFRSSPDNSACSLALSAAPKSPLKVIRSACSHCHQISVFIAKLWGAARFIAFDNFL